MALGLDVLPSAASTGLRNLARRCDTNRALLEHPKESTADKAFGLVLDLSRHDFSRNRTADKPHRPLLPNRSADSRTSVGKAANVEFDVLHAMIGPTLLWPLSAVNRSMDLPNSEASVAMDERAAQDQPLNLTGPLVDRRDLGITEISRPSTGPKQCLRAQHP